MADIERQLTERARTTAIAALEVVPFAMLIADGSGHALAVNSRWMELSGLGRADSVGPGWLSVLDPEARSRLREVVVGVANEGGPATIDLQIAAGPQPRWVRWWASRHELDGVPLLAVAAVDVDADYNRQADLYYLATHDSLTGLVNRNHFLESIERALQRGRRQQRRVAVVYVDLDDFKRVNDGGGHSLGDRVLYAIAARLRHAVRAADMVARIGGDEFAVLCEGLTAGEQADAVARRIAAALTESVELDGQRWLVAASVGAAMDRGEVESPEHLVDRADQAMYTVKLARRPAEGPPEEPSPGTHPWAPPEATPAAPASPWRPAAAGSAAPAGPEPSGWGPAPASFSPVPAGTTFPPIDPNAPPAASPPVAASPPADPSAPPAASPPVAASPPGAMTSQPVAASPPDPATVAEPAAGAAPRAGEVYRGPERRAGTRRRDDWPSEAVAAATAVPAAAGRSDILDPDEARRALHELAQAASEATAAFARPSPPSRTSPPPAAPLRSPLPPEAGTGPETASAPMAGSGSGAGSRGEPFGAAGATATTTTARTALSTAGPPAETDESEASRERLARDVMKLRESIDAIRRTLDRVLSGASEEAGVIDIRDRS